MKRDVTFNHSYLGKRAIVVGAGVGGLSAARALSDYFDELMILDRDELPDDATQRLGVPQGKHPHALLGGGLKALENLFPGFGNELMRAGRLALRDAKIRQLIIEIRHLLKPLALLDGSSIVSRVKEEIADASRSDESLV